MSLALYRISFNRPQRPMNTTLPVLTDSPRALERVVSGGSKGSSGHLAHKQSLHWASWLRALTLGVIRHSPQSAETDNSRLLKAGWCLQMPSGQLERVVSGGSEGSGGQLARTSSHYMGPVGSEALTQHWVQHGWGDAGHVMNRCVLPSSVLSCMIISMRMGVSVVTPAILQCAEGTWCYRGSEHQADCPRATLFQYVLQADR